MITKHQDVAADVPTFITAQAQQSSEKDLAFRTFRPSPARNWDEQKIYQRGIEAVSWAMPAVSMTFFRESAFATYGINYNDVIAFSQPLAQRHELLTANSQAPYVLAFLDLRQGPVVMEVPAATDKSALYGQVVDAWQVSIADIGPSGEDKGKGGKYLFIPPGYDQPIPEGYIPIRSQSYLHNMLLRSVALGNATQADQVAYSHRLRIYSLAKVDNPTPTRFVDGFPRGWDSLPHYDMRFYQYIADLVSVEPVRARDKVMMGMLLSLGIEPGKPFTPDARTAEILTQSVVDARATMEGFFEVPVGGLTPFWPDRQWSVVNGLEDVAGFTYESPTTILLDNRAVLFYYATFLPKSLSGGGTFYVGTMRDSNGDMLKGDRVYRLRVPAEVPAREFWSVIAYDLYSKSFIFNESNRTGISSFDKSKMNADGTVDIHFSTKAPAGFETNWIPTNGRDFFLFFRFYGPEKAVFDRSFKLPDLERVPN